MTADVTRWANGCRMVGAVRWRLDPERCLWRCDALEGERVTEHHVGCPPPSVRTQAQAHRWADRRILAELRRVVRVAQRRIAAVTARETEARAGR